MSLTDFVTSAVAILGPFIPLWSTLILIIFIFVAILAGLIILTLGSA